ncbi:MAG: hypothetical protein QOK16_2323 [Solirubrobacteraceae bacterium]|nr:hypothetical protein [Solirubrobacteraceae bacterium]
MFRAVACRLVGLDPWIRRGRQAPATPATIADPVPETTLIGGGRPRHETCGKIRSPTPAACVSRSVHRVSFSWTSDHRGGGTGCGVRLVAMFLGGGAILVDLFRSASPRAEVRFLPDVSRPALRRASRRCGERRRSVLYVVRPGRPAVFAGVQRPGSSFSRGACAVRLTAPAVGQFRRSFTCAVPAF